MLEVRAYKTELAPTNYQKTKFRQNFGAARYAYNFALIEKKKAIEKFKETGDKEKIPNAIDLHKVLNKKKGTEELPWGFEVSKCAFQESMRDCDQAFKRFFSNCKKKSGKKGFPKFKSKKNEKQSFRVTGSIKVTESGHIQIPTIGRVKLKELEYLPLNAHILSASISSRAGKFFISLSVREEVNKETVTAKNLIVGVDLGIKTLAVLSTGESFANPKALKKREQQLKRAQRKLSKSKKDSKNRAKQKVRVQRIHYKISNIRKDALHKATTKITNENQVIVIEDLSVSGMLKNHKLAKSVADVSFYEFRRQLTYKSERKGRELRVVDRFFTSSKTCSCCGHKKESLLLNERIFSCEKCGKEIDRDLNAAINLENAKFYTVSSTGSKIRNDVAQASGEGSSFDWETGRISPSAKEESDISLKS